MERIFGCKKGNYELSEGFEIPTRGTREAVDYDIQLVNEVRRTLDYLTTRDDINPDNIAYLGYSWGVLLGPIVLATENQFGLGLFLSGGVSANKSQPVINVTTFKPRIKVPILIISGRYDFIFPFETSQKLMFDLLEIDKED